MQNNEVYNANGIHKMPTVEELIMLAKEKDLDIQGSFIDNIDPLTYDDVRE